MGARQHLELWAGFFLTCGTACVGLVYLHHLTSGLPSWVLNGVSLTDRRGKLLACSSVHLGSQWLRMSSCVSAPRGYKPGKWMNSREGGWTLVLDLTSWTVICIFRSCSQPVGCLWPPHSPFKGPECGGRMHLTLPLQHPAALRCLPLGRCAPWTQGEWVREVGAAWVRDSLPKTEGCGGWGRFWGIPSISMRAACSVPEHLGRLCGVALILERTCLPSEHRHFISSSFSSGKRSLGCFLEFWKIVVVKAGK